jgi:hypothetical protein
MNRQIAFAKRLEEKSAKEERKKRNLLIESLIKINVVD